MSILKLSGYGRQPDEHPAPDDGPTSPPPEPLDAGAEVDERSAGPSGAGARSPLRRTGYGDGRTGSGRMTSDGLGPERNGPSPNGIPVPGYARRVLADLAGQPPLAVHGDWGASPRSWGTQGWGM